MRGIVKGIEREYPCFNNALDQLLPKKEMAVAKWCALRWRSVEPATAPRPPPQLAPPPPPHLLLRAPPQPSLTACNDGAQPGAPQRRAAGSDAAVL